MLKCLGAYDIEPNWIDIVTWNDSVSGSIPEVYAARYSIVLVLPTFTHEVCYSFQPTVSPSAMAKKASG